MQVTDSTGGTTVVTVTVFAQPPRRSPVDGIQIAFSGVGGPPATFDRQFDTAGTYTVTLNVFNDADGDATSIPITVVVG